MVIDYPVPLNRAAYAIGYGVPLVNVQLVWLSIIVPRAWLFLRGIVQGAYCFSSCETIGRSVPDTAKADFGERQTVASEDVLYNLRIFAKVSR